MMRSLVLIAVLCPAVCIFAQQERWDSYTTDFEKGPGTIILDMALIDRAPDRELPYVIVTGIPFKGCLENGLATEEQMSDLYSLTDQIEQRIKHDVYSKLAGSFTYQCEHLNYVYVEDTAGIRSQLKKLYKELYPGQVPYISIQEDSIWQAYLDFLYPYRYDEAPEYYSLDAWEQLQAAGDDLSQERPVDHWIYFQNSDDLEAFANYAQEMGFQLKVSEETEDEKLPYLLIITRMESIDVTFNVLIENLELKAEELNGVYDGWETTIITGQ